MRRCGRSSIEMNRTVESRRVFSRIMRPPERWPAMSRKIAGCLPSSSCMVVADGGPDQGDDEKFGSVDKPVAEQWPYHAVAAVVRAHSLVRSFPEVDADRTAVTGISWGGYLTCIVAGIDPRFKAAVPVYGCG